MALSTQDRERISAAIRAAESKTTGEIVCVLAQTSTDSRALPVVVAAIAALALPWLLVAFTALSVTRILSLQILAFLAVSAALSLPRFRVALLPRAARRAVAHRAALEQFHIRGVSRTKDRTGILIFVSLAERYARIIADEGIAARVPQSEWQDAIDTLVMHMREDRVADGFVSAVDICGKELAAHFPRQAADRDELPDRIYLI